MSDHSKQMVQEMENRKHRRSRVSLGREMALQLFCTNNTANQ